MPNRQTAIAYVKVFAQKVRAVASIVAALSSDMFQVQERPIREIRHLNFSIHKAIDDVRINRQVDKKLKEKFYADRFVLVAAFPKSASSVISSCIMEIYPHKGASDFASYMDANQDSDLRPEMVKDYLKGGVMKYHPRATGKNLKVLDLLGARYIILLRHPIDQVTAVYCHYLRWFSSASNNTEDSMFGYLRGRRFVYDHIIPLPISIFQAGVDSEDALSHLICDGYLQAALSWMAEWLQFRDPERSLVIRYEDFVTDSRETLNSISTFLLDKPLSEETFERCETIATDFFKRREPLIGQRPYEHGWTGKIGTWKDYFSERNRSEYVSVTQRYLDLYPGASKLLTVYPNLFEIDPLE